jgi:Ni/Co efflux regulator RcnB
MVNGSFAGRVADRMKGLDMKRLVRMILLVTMASACLMPGMAQSAGGASASSDRQTQKRQAERDRKEEARRRKEEEKRALQQAGVRCSRLNARH